MTYAPAHTVTFAKGHIRQVITPDNLYTEMARAYPDLDYQLNMVAGVCGVEVPWRWHATQAVLRTEGTKEALADAGYCKTWVEWYLGVINEFEANLAAATGAGLALKGSA